MQCSLGGRKAVRAALAAILLAASAACSDSSADKASPTATVATEPPPTTTTDPYAVPAVIDVAYVNRVLAGLDAVMGDVTRLVVRTRTIPQEAYDRIKAVYATSELFQLVIDGIQSDERKGFPGYKPEPGNRNSLVTQLLTAQPRCIFASVQREYSAVSVNANPVNPQWVALRPLDRNRDPHGYNPTDWGYVYDGFPQDRSQPANPCVA